MSSPCANADQCHYWPRHDDRCDRNTEPHSAMCSVHQDRDYETWYYDHSQEECCQHHCPVWPEGEEIHE